MAPNARPQPPRPTLRQRSSARIPLLRSLSSSFQSADSPNFATSTNATSLAEIEMEEKARASSPSRDDIKLPGDVITADGDVARDQSYADILASETTSVFEKKCLLINREIDRMGMGKYQWYIWILCGFGYFLDLLWAQAFGLVLSPLQQEFGFGNTESGNISVSFSAGLTAGAAFWGILVDIIGRKWAFNITVLFSSVFGLALGGANSYNTFLVLTAFVGFGVGGNIPIDTTITLESIPQQHRRLLPFLSVFQPIGVVVTTALAYAFVPHYGCKPDFTQGAQALKSCNDPSIAPGEDCCGKSNNMGWRYLLFTLGAFTIFVFIMRTIVFRFQESPKYLVSRNNDAEAIRVLRWIFRFNGDEHGCRLNLEDLHAVEANASLHSGKTGEVRTQIAVKAKTWKEKLYVEALRYKLLFATWPMAALTTLVWLTYFCDYWGFTVAGTFLPKIIAAKNAEISLSLEFTYRSYIYIYAPGIVGVLLGVLCYDIPRVGRKLTMAISSGLMAASLFLFSRITTEASNIGLNAMEYFFQSMFNSVLYGWTPEAFPAPIRGTACGVASFWGRLAGIISPLIAAGLMPSVSDPHPDFNAVLYLAGGVTITCVLWTLLLPSKLVGGDSY